MLLNKSFDDIDQSTLNELVDAGATETVHLEFKRDTYGTSDADKKEFLKDISAFANSLGGHLIIGMNEEDGAAFAINPLKDVDVDQELLRLENIVRTGAEPKIIGLRMKRVAVTGGDVVVVYIPRSYNPPHRVIFKNTNRYYARNSSGVYELSLEELRGLFGQQRSLEDRAKAFVNERFLQVQANQGAFSLPVDFGVMVMHLIPLADLGMGRRHQIPTLRSQKSAFCPLGVDSFSSRVNLDGMVVFRGGPECHGYTQVFRNGCVEATKAKISFDRDGLRYFPSLSWPEWITGALTRYLNGLNAMNASLPILLQISVFGTNGLRIGLKTHNTLENPTPYDKEELHLPATVISEYQPDGNYQKVVAEQMDFLWNAFDLERCQYFDEEGNWVSRKN